MINLASSAVTCFLATSDAEAAKRFYGEVLGLHLAEEDDYALVYQLNGTELRLSKVPSFEPFAWTVLDWQVEDLSDFIEKLKEHKIAPLVYEGMGQDESGVWTTPDGACQILWFKDPDGNVLSFSKRQ